MFDHEALRDESSSFIGTLREVLYDSDNDASMIDSDLKAVNMDQMMGNYVRTMPLQDGSPRSVDAMVISCDDTFFLIEYKNGKKGERKQRCDLE